MKRGWMFFLLLTCLAVPAAVHAQVSAYAEFSAANLANGPKGDELFGGQGGVLIDGPRIFHRFLVSADINGRFVGKDGERLDSVSVGPRFSAGPFNKVTPFVGFDIGFGRYNDGSNNATTDVLFGGSGGLSRRITSRLDVVADFKYEYYGANFNFFNPRTISGGLIYHFVKR